MTDRLDWASDAIRLIEQDGAAVLVTQCIVDGSAPREAGTKILVSKSKILGTIGGGNLEHQATMQARRMLERDDVTHLLQDYPLGPLLRQCCGGHVRLLLERLDARDTGWLEHIASMAEQPGEHVLETRLDGTGQRKTLYRRKDWPHVLKTGFLGHDASLLPDNRPARDVCAVFFEQVSALPPAVMLFGAGHVGQAIAHVLSISPLPIRWFDSRPDYLGTRSGIEISHLTDPEEAVSSAPPAAIHLVLTHDHELDYRLTRAILQRGDFAFCGLIGSATKRARFIRRLREDSVPQAAISRLTSPIGLPEISGKAPATIAVAVAGQILQIPGDAVSADTPRQASNASVLRA